MPESQVNQLAAAGRIWDDICAELQGTGATGDDYGDKVLVAPEELKKIGKLLTHSVTKYGASASVADGPERLLSLKPIAEEVTKAYTAAVGTLLAMKHGAGGCLLAELRDAGSGLSQAVEGLGQAAAIEGNEVTSVAAAKVLERARHFERVSTHNRAAVRRQILRSLAQLRDAHKELNQALASAPQNGEADGTEGLQSDGDIDSVIDEEERPVVEAVLSVVKRLEEMVQAASLVCVPGAGVDPATVAKGIDLEEATVVIVKAAHSVDTMAAHSIGGVDPRELNMAIQELRNTADGLAVVSPNTVESLRSDLDALKATLDACDLHVADPIEAASSVA
eukprot:TRINITY_DN40946_c0_g1_i1.p1 TRINITY_DN40946_c0_g1~~TRINITY_DN40946_c0_g1_i1.p1  ORF type:complete len:336 (-),score=90.42 TRINITY_DN40946_c0_g1_i1:45-1052(-)